MTFLTPSNIETAPENWGKSTQEIWKIPIWDLTIIQMGILEFCELSGNTKPVIHRVIAFLSLARIADQCEHKDGQHWETHSWIDTVAAQKKAGYRNVILKDDISEAFKYWGDALQKEGKSSSGKIDKQCLRPNYSSQGRYRSLWAIWREMITYSRSYSVFQFGRAGRSYRPQIWTTLRPRFNNCNGFASEKDQMQERHPWGWLLWDSQILTLPRAHWAKSSSRKIVNRCSRPNYFSNRDYRSLWAIWREMKSYSRSYNILKCLPAWRSSGEQIRTALRATFRNSSGSLSGKGPVQKGHPEGWCFCTRPFSEARRSGFLN
jgi:hypothetical protein